MDVNTFISENKPHETAETFELENSRLLDISVDGTVMAKAGSMVAYDGDLTFTGKLSAEGGVTGLLKSAASSEGTPVMKAEGTGNLYLADQAKKVQILQLGPDESISVNGDDILAFESHIDYKISTVGSFAGVTSGGLTNVFLDGPGSIAITTHGDPLVLSPPVKTDPSATVAWSGEASPSGSINRSLTDMVGQSSDERLQLEFTDESGFVVVQPFEEGGVRQ